MLNMTAKQMFTYFIMLKTEENMNKR